MIDFQCSLGVEFSYAVFTWYIERTDAEKQQNKANASSYIRVVYPLPKYYYTFVE